MNKNTIISKFIYYSKQKENYKISYESIVSMLIRSSTREYFEEWGTGDENLEYIIHQLAEALKLHKFNEICSLLIMVGYEDIVDICKQLINEKCIDSEMLAYEK